VTTRAIPALEKTPAPVGEGTVAVTEEPAGPATETSTRLASPSPARARRKASGRPVKRAYAPAKKAVAPAKKASAPVKKAAAPAKGPVIMHYVDRYAAGKALRESCPRKAHAGWKAPAQYAEAAKR